MSKDVHSNVPRAHTAPYTNTPLGQRSPAAGTSLDCLNGDCRNGDCHNRLSLIVLSCVATLILVGLLLVVRRFGGALLEPFPTGHMLFTALIAAALAAYSRTAWRHIRLAKYPQRKDGYPQRKMGAAKMNNTCLVNFPWSRLDRWVGWGSSMGLILLAVGCTYPAERLGDWLVWLPLLVTDQFWRQSYFDGRQPAAPLFSGIIGRRKVVGGRQKAANPAAPLSSSQPDDLASTIDSPPGHLSMDRDEQLLQQLFRIRDAAGRETIYGTLRANFVSGQRNASLYIGFCPPLTHLPQVEAEPIDGPAATLKVVQALAHGARVDLRLDRPASQECHVLVDLAALGSA